MKSLFIIIVTFITATFGFAKNGPHKEKQKVYKIIPGQTLEINNQFKIKHEGYGHRISPAGEPADRESFFSFEFEEISVDKSKTLERTSQRMFVPLRGVETMSWHNFVIHVTRCEDQGPPHDNTAPVEFYVEERQTKVK